AAAVRGLPEAGDARPTPSLEAAIFERVPESAGELLLSFERWVVDAATGAVAVAVGAGGWVLARFDARVVGAPVNSLATGTVRGGRSLEPLLGGSLARVAWWLLGALALGALVQALWWR